MIHNLHVKHIVNLFPNVFLIYNRHFFTLRANRSHNKAFIVAHVRLSFTTASWATALPLQRPRLVNSSG